MSQLKITNAGVTYKDAVFAGQEIQNITHFIFRKVDNLSTDDVIDLDQVIPTQDIVHLAPIERVSSLNDNAVVMSATLGYDDGDFKYNWFGAVATKADGSQVLIAVVQTELQSKTKTQGAVTGNYSVKSIVWRTSSIAQSLNVQLSTLPWQVESGTFVTQDELLNELDEKLDKNNGNVTIKPLAADHGTLTLEGLKNSYAGIHFSAVNHTLMVHQSTQGFYNHTDNVWDWYFTNGVLTQGTVPLASVTGKGDLALRAGVNTFTAANNFADSLMVKGNHVYHVGNLPSLATLGAATKVGSIQNPIFLGITNLNSIVNAGHYYQDSNNGAQNGGNYPASLAGSLTVTKAAGIVQTYATYGGNALIYSRALYDGTWSAWVVEYNSGNKPSPASIGAALATHSHPARNSITNYNASYDVIGKSIHANSKSIDYVNQLHFKSGCHFVDNSNLWLDFKWQSNNQGGIKFNNTNGLVGHVYGDNSAFGILNKNGNWALRGASDKTEIHVGSVKKLSCTTERTISHADIEFDAYGKGMVGVYIDTRWQQVFAMGAAYTAADDGTSIAGGYGVFWTHSNNADAQARKVQGHQMCIVTNGVTTVALGNSIWTEGNVTCAGVTSSSMIHANAGLGQDGHVILNGSDTWVRTKDADGIFFSAYGGGWHMTDASYIRAYGGKGLLVDNASAKSINTSGGVEVGEGIYRKSHGKGALIGSYNNVGSNSLYSNPIYCIGSLYQPSNTALVNMYGTGYCTSSAPFLSWVTGASAWGQYVAANGEAKIFLDASSGKIHAKGDIGGFQTSDRNLKDEIKPVTVDVNLHMSLEPSHYRKLVKGRAASKCGTTPKVEDSHVFETGMFAQQMQKLGFHNFVHKNDDGDLTLKQGGNELHAYHIAVTQDLYKAIDSQADLIEKLSKRLDAVEKLVA